MCVKARALVCLELVVQGLVVFLFGKKNRQSWSPCSLASHPQVIKATESNQDSDLNDQNAKLPIRFKVQKASHLPIRPYAIQMGRETKAQRSKVALGKIK